MSTKIYKISPISLMFLSLVSCFSNQTEFEVRKWKKNTLTNKEIQFIAELKRNGYYQIEIDKQIIGQYAYGMSSYGIYFKKKINTAKVNADSIREISFQIAKVLVDHVIEDSIIYDCNEIIIHFTVLNGQKYWSREFFLPYKKKQLEKELNFKVNKNYDGSYQRVKM